MMIDGNNILQDVSALLLLSRCCQHELEGVQKSACLVHHELIANTVTEHHLHELVKTVVLIIKKTQNSFFFINVIWT